MWDVVLDAFLDTLKILPILLIANFLIEYFEFKASCKVYNSKLLNGKLSPLFASAVGLIPQCGFSVVATNLFSTKKIAIGTLLAIFITTSDEAIPIMLGSGKSALMLVPLLLGKFALALVVGYLFNLIFDMRAKKQSAKVAVKQVNVAASGTVLVEKNGETQNKTDVKPETKETEQSGESGHGHNHAGQVHGEHKHEHGASENESSGNNGGSKVDYGCHHHKIGKDNKWWVHPIVHSLIVLLYIFIATLIFGLLIYYIGETKIANFISSTKLVAPFLVALVGLIPNCASSVIIAQSLVGGMISFGAAFAGLCANAGIALAVLFKQNKNQKQNLFILVSLYLISSIVGFLIDLIF